MSDGRKPNPSLKRTARPRSLLLGSEVVVWRPFRRLALR